MPEITPDERGRRVFQIHREKAVESAVDRIRENLGQDWKLLSGADITILRFILSEAWVSMGREQWGRCAFSRLGKRDIEAIIEIGIRIKDGEEEEKSGIRRTMKILEKTA